MLAFLLHAALTVGSNLAGSPQPGPPAPAPAADHASPEVWAVVVGVGALAEARLGAVEHGPADAEALRDYLTTVGRVPADHVLLLADGGEPFLDPAAPVGHAAPTRRNVRVAIGGWLAQHAGPKDLALVAWSGQGATGPGGEPLLLPADAAGADLVGSAIEARWLAQTLGALPSAAALWLDTSFAGRAVARPGAAASPTAAAAPSELVPGARGLVWLAASGAVAVEAAGAPHGAFTQALLAALRGAGASADDAWQKLVQALPASAPRPVRAGHGDLAPLLGARGGGPARERPELVLQTPHMGRIEFASFDPTSRLLATTGNDGTLKLWDVASHRIIANLDMAGESGLAAWSPDGQRVLAESSVGVSVWSAAGRPLWTAPIAPASWPARIAKIQLFMAASARFSPDGALVGMPHLDRPGELVSAADGRVVTRLPEPVVGPIVWDPSGARLAYIAKNGTDVRVVRRAGMGAVASVEATIRGTVEVGALVFSGDGRTLAVGRIGSGGDFPPQDVTLYDTAKKLAVRKLAAPLVTNLPPVASPDGAVLAVPALDGVSFVALDTLALAHTPPGQGGGLAQLAADGKTLAIIMADDTRLYDTRTGALVKQIPGEAIAITPDLGSVLAGSSSNWGTDLAFRDVTGRVPPVALEATARPVLGLARGARDGTMRVIEPDRVTTWDMTSGRPIADATLAPPTASVPSTATATAPTTAALTSPDGTRAVSVDEQGILRVKDLATGVESAPQATGVPFASDLVWLGRSRVAFHPRPRFPDAVCVAVKSLPPEQCARWDEATPPEAKVVTVWDLDRRARFAALEGHRGVVTGLFATADGKTLVSSSADSTLRVWDVATARALATVAILDRGGAPATAERWVVTTPDGLFDGSPEGQAEMQWRVGDALFRLEQFAGDFYTPGLLAKLLAGERPRAASAIEELRPPPRVKIASPARGQSVPDGVVKVVVSVDDVGGGASPAWLYVNGHRVPATRSRRLGGPTTVFEVELAEGENHLRATAFNGDGSVESAGDEVDVVWSVPEAERPVLHLVAVGVDAYQDETLRLSFATADAKAIAQAFTPGLFARIDTTLLLDDKATRAGIRDALAALTKTAKPRDAVLVYLAGHGTLVGSTFYYLPYEARAASDEDVARTGLSQSDLAEALTQIAATKQIVILDACHSGAGAAALGRLLGSGNGDRDPLGMARAQRRLARASGVFLVAAATAAQKAGEIRELGHGVLTYAILTGLGTGGKPPAAQLTADGQVTVNALLAWLDDEVPRLTARHHGGPQTPVQASTGQDFPIVQEPASPP
ncbi:MAG: caspase family protein [Myxococcota bacterium]